jgi:DNA-binding response OmpR family regulator
MEAIRPWRATIVVEKKKVLVVEDERTLRDTLTYNLSHEGYAVLGAGDGRTAVEMARKERPDLIVLDLMLPEMDGFEVCRTLRQEMTAPIVMLTARDGELDTVLGLELGADDYITKPFALRLFLARVKAHLRRAALGADSQGAGDDRLAFGDFVLDCSGRRLLKGDAEIALTMKEYDLLHLLLNNAGKVLSRDVLLEKVWGYDFVGDSRTVDVHVRWLREKIEADPGEPRRIITVRGVGYRFESAG